MKQPKLAMLSHIYCIISLGFDWVIILMTLDRKPMGIRLQCASLFQFKEPTAPTECILLFFFSRFLVFK